ncbi:hypothetical protein BVX98_07995 [bacterium F11]|nr:hypothetical protein BVX98_07995 [bacterium F11]
MKKAFYPLIAVLFVAFCSQVGAQSRPSYVPNQVIVCVRDNINLSRSQYSQAQFHQVDSHLSSLLKEIKAKSMKPLFGAPQSSSYVQSVSARAKDRNSFYRAVNQRNRTILVTLEDGGDVKKTIKYLSKKAGVEYAHPNHYYYPSVTIPNDPFYGTQWGLKNTGQDGGADFYDPSGRGTEGSDIDAEVAWDTHTGTTGVVVAIIDTGLDWDHPDIEGNLWQNVGESSGTITTTGVDNDGNGKIDDNFGYDFGDDDGDPDDDCYNSFFLFDFGGHGTHVSGIVGADGNNAVGVSGVNWIVSLMALKVAPSNCLITTDAFADAIRYATDEGADVINISLGGEADSTVEIALNYAELNGVVLIAAAGNEATSNSQFSYPAAYDNVMAVAATDRNDQLGTFSNFGSWVQISGPGVAIRSTLPVQDGSYAFWSGTSMASPMVAGIAGLVLAQYPSLTDDEVYQRLLDSTEDIDSLNPGFGGQLGAGRVNVARAMMSVTGISPSFGLNTTTSVDLTVSGISLVPESTLSLKNGSETISATNVAVPNSTTITGTVNLLGATAGLWDVVVTAGQTVKTLASTFTIVEVTVTSVDPSTAPITSTSTVVSITGTKFTSDLTISLTRSGFPSIAASTQAILSDTAATAEFDLTGADRGGRWDVTMSKLGSSSSLEDGFGIITTAFNVLPIGSNQGIQTSVQAPQGLQVINWPAGTINQDILLDFDAYPDLPSVNTTLDPFASSGIGTEVGIARSTLTPEGLYTVILEYRLVDLSDPDNEDSLTLAKYNSTTGRWEPITSTVDKVLKTVTTELDSFGMFALLQHVPASSLSHVVAYPNPFRADQHQPQVNFDLLTAGARLRIYDLSGELVQDLLDNNRDGFIPWLLDTKNGKKVASGIYTYLITDPSGDKKIGRVGIVR